MQIIAQIASTISGLGKYLMVPLMIAIIGLCFGCNPNKAIKGGITVGIGLFGLDLALSLVGTYLGPVGTALVQSVGLNLDVFDVGWTALSGVAYATQVGAFIIPYMVLWNIVLLAIGATMTIDIDIWNYWHAALVGSLIATITDNLIYGFVSATAFQTITYAIGDRSAEDVQEVLGLPGISIPHGGCIVSFSLGYVMEWIYNLIGGKKEGKEANETTAKKINENKVFNTLKDPIYVGLIIGTILGIVALKDAKQGFLTGMAMSALLYLTPRMVKILMEGLVPISEACQKIMNKKFKGQQLYIGMDNAVGLGHATCMTGAVIMIPICILIAAFLPGNRIIPMASLASCGYNCSMINCCHKGNLWRVILTTSLMIAIALFGSSALAPIVTDVAKAAGFQTDYALICSISGDTCVTTFFYMMFNISPILGVGVSAAIVVVLIVVQKAYFKKKTVLNTREFVGTDKAAYK